MLIYKNLNVTNLKTDLYQSIIACHGGYTPRRNFIQRGSGELIIPDGIVINFYSNPDKPSIGKRAINAIINDTLPSISETVLPGQKVPNYSLTPDEHKFSNIIMNQDSSFVLIRPINKCHLKDVIEFCLKNNIKVINFFACRINKLDKNALKIVGPMS